MKQQLPNVLFAHNQNKHMYMLVLLIVSFRTHKYSFVWFGLVVVVQGLCGHCLERVHCAHMLSTTKCNFLSQVATISSLLLVCSAMAYINPRTVFVGQLHKACNCACLHRGRVGLFTFIYKYICQERLKLINIRAAILLCVVFTCRHMQITQHVNVFSELLHELGTTHNNTTQKAHANVFD